MNKDVTIGDGIVGVSIDVVVVGSGDGVIVGVVIVVVYGNFGSIATCLID